ncbi:ABC transporter ATP-binding protein [Euzebya tangerina]
MSTDDTKTMIRLEGVSKTYPGTTVPAVSDLDLEIPEGEILVLVGPSGCGKSTTLRLINRMIEPSSGRIIFDGEDVTSVDADKLRRRIGYVIQQIGLFPHLTIKANIATVPKLLGWSNDRIESRVDELLDLVGMDPGQYRDRFPKELSGGQAQRVGVARALAADPPVMLMDEPFGAIDPITRDRLQNEFLRVQEELKKTIVFVTHDIDEAIKMGDRIAVLGEQSRIAQFDTPERILAFPVDDFVSDFIGSGATLKGLNLERVRDIKLDDFPRVASGSPRREVQAAMETTPDGWAMVVDEGERPLRWVHRSDLERTDKPLVEVGQPIDTIEQNATLRDALELMLHSSTACATVVDKDQAYVGVIRMTTLNERIEEMQHDARVHYDELSRQVSA